MRIYFLRRKQRDRAIELGLPIPGTGKRSRGHYYRRPRNIGVRREYAKEEFPLLRKSKIPPNSWDDIAIGSAYNRNWKKFRKHQWKD